MYAGRKRRKPVQRTAKPPPPEGVKSNPSKRHRDRLNSELERLAGLLPFPEEVVSTLDKLSILRLSVSYLRAKSFFHIALKSHCGKGGAERSGDRDKGRTLGRADGILPEGELLLQALNGFVLVVTSEGEIFYSSHTIQDYLGFHQTDVLHQSVFELIHTEDQPEFRRNLHWALSPPPVPESAPSPEGDAGVGSSLPAYEPGQLPPENSAFLERSFVCRFRCLLDNSSGFLPLNLQGRLKFLHGQKQRSEDRSLLPPQLALFVISTPLQPPSILEIRTKNMIFRTKHTLDFTPLACDAKGKIVLGYTEAELRMCGTGYQFIHAADMLYCAENHVRMMKTGESGLTVFRLLTKNNCWKWMQANARLVYKNGKPDYIIATQRPLAEEEGGEHLRKRSTHLPFTFAMGEALLYQSACPCPGFPEPFPSKGKPRKPKKHSPGKGGWPQKDSVDPSSLLGAMMRQNEAVYASHPASTPKHAVSRLLAPHQGDSGFSGSGEDSWSGVANPLASGETGPKPTLADGRPGDPLLSTLGSLSSSSDEACSTNELFAALEGLGLTAEDLELLLLDERMVRVDLDLDHVPSLNDLLTNNEILSYVHGSLASRCEGGPTGEQQTCPLSGSAPNPSPDLGACPSQTPEERYPCSPQPPSPLILHLPQQMQQRLASQSPQGSQPWEPPLSCGCNQPPPPLMKQADEEKQPPSLQWRLPAGAAEVGPSPIGQAPLGNRPQGPQWVRPPGSSHLHQPLALPYRQQQPAPSLESSPYAVPGAAGPFLQQSQPCLPPRPAPAHTEPPSQLMLKPNQHLLVNRPDSHGSAGRPGPGNNPWQGCWPVNQPPRGLPAQPRVCGVERGHLCLPQLYPAPAPNPGGAALPFYLDGLPSTGTGASGACREEMTPCPGFVPPSSYHPKPPSPVPSASQYPASEHWGAAHGQQEGSMHSYGTHAAFLGQENIRKRESDCVLTSANVGYPGDCLLPNGNPAPSDELHSCMAALPNHSDPASGGFYL